MRIGVFGGTFNPIHFAHLAIVTGARDALSLDRVLLMVAADPPHKTVADSVSAEHRFQMTRLAARDLPGVEPSDLELRRPGKSYMVDTLRALHALEPEAELYLIVGSDMLRDIPGWSRPKELLSACTIACVPRRGQEAGDAAAKANLETTFGARVTFLPDCADKLSSTAVRERVHDALPVEDMTPLAVQRYFYEHGLYFPERLRAMQGRLMETLDIERYRHVCDTTLEAVRLAAQFPCDRQKARLAALLHDCAKRLPRAELDVLSGDDTDVWAVKHAFAGAVVAKMRYGVTDDTILRAIRLHATGDRDMTTLEKVIFLADITEPGRDYDGVESLRDELKKGLDCAMLLALTRNAEIIRTKGFSFHSASTRALADMVQRCQQQQKEDDH